MNIRNMQPGYCHNKGVNGLTGMELTCLQYNTNLKIVYCITNKPAPPLLSAQDRHCPPCNARQAKDRSQRALHAAARCQIARHACRQQKPKQASRQCQLPRQSSWQHSPMHRSDLRMHWRAICLSSYCK